MSLPTRNGRTVAEFEAEIVVWQLELAAGQRELERLREILKKGPCTTSWQPQQDQEGEAERADLLGRQAQLPGDQVSLDLR
jgi:hypothetical protein